ncbi:MAG TPA: 4-(cytidine 5'-diphospho)-2-C-methyl-D-erythritol kinase [Phycisphaerae bacterium]|nr:4-(cytidine 5'-diphospho)-2-C-methyl-D-erythritol kinase [Phycisphaerae bacterium]
MTGQPDIPELLPPRERFEELHGGALHVAAPAKINLDLRVGPRREDGYHGLDSIVAKVTLYDLVLLRPREDGRIAFRCDGADCGPDESNLALRAARLLAEAAGDVPGADLSLTKAIPPGKGLGGGSSDAAAVLDGLNELWSLGFPAERLAGLAARLGSDVPLFLGPPAARMTGRGERIEPANVHPFVAVLHLPGVACSTAEVYRRFDQLPPPDAGPRLPALEDLAGSPPAAWRSALRNDLAAPALAVSGELRRVHELLREAVGLPVGLTGSGSGLFVLCDDQAEARTVVGRIPPGLGGRTVLVGPNPW